MERTQTPKRSPGHARALAMVAFLRLSDEDSCFLCRFVGVDKLDAETEAETLDAVSLISAIAQAERKRLAGRAR